MIRNLKRILFVFCTGCAVMTAANPTSAFHYFLIYSLTLTCLAHAILSSALDVKSVIARDYHLPWWFDVLFAGAMLTAFVMSGWWWCAGAWALILLGICDSNSREEEA